MTLAVETLSAQPHPSRAISPADPLRVVLVGCGAVAKANLLPALAGDDRISIVALVDRDEPRARSLAEAYGVTQTFADLDTITPAIAEAAILATPPAHHAPATIALATKGLHIFVEKPMATSAHDAAAMVAAAERAGVQLSVGLYRRLLPAVNLLRTLLEERSYGRVLEVDIEEGGSYGWQLATLDLLTKERGGGGVLIDIGSHLIDLILSVLPGPVSFVSAADNARGGIETDSLIKFSVAHGDRQVPVRMELSRTRDLRNSIRVKCERATIELKRASFIELHVHPETTGRTGGQTMCLSADWPGKASYVGYEAFRAQFENWLDAIEAGTESGLSGRSVLPVVALIDTAYTRRVDLLEPWTDAGLSEIGAPAIVQRTGSRPRVLITGAGGFLGGRTAEILHGSGQWDVVAMVREPKGAARLARWPIEVTLGDITDHATMDGAVNGCDAVVHCAVGTSWKADESRAVTVNGTRTVANAALRAGVRRLVHISTMNVHKRHDIGEIFDERAPLEPPPTEDYGLSKLDAERAVDEAAKRGLSTIVLRPTRIYGPFSRTFTVRPLQALAQGRFAVAGPEMPANMVYVDNVVAAISRALIVDPRPGSDYAYLITDPEQLTLRDFYEVFARRIGTSVGLAPADSLATDVEKRAWVSRWSTGVRTVLLSPEVRALVKRILETDPVGNWPRHLWDTSPRLQARALKMFKVDAAVVYRKPVPEAPSQLTYRGESARVTSQKAEGELGFIAPVTLARALELTLAWAEAARLVRAQ